MCLIQAGTVRIAIGSARNAANWFASNGAEILGLEGFTTDGRGVRPDLNYIADFSNVATFSDPPDQRVKLALAAALKAVQSWDSEGAPIFIEFVLREGVGAGAPLSG
jgi:hypothetical protein